MKTLPGLMKEVKGVKFVEYDETGERMRKEVPPASSEGRSPRLPAADLERLVHNLEQRLNAMK